MRTDAWMEREFWGVDAIIHCAALVHSAGKSASESDWMRVNARLPEVLAKKAKAEGVKAFVFMSTLAVYGFETGHITPDTYPPMPKTPYGRSKLEAERRISGLWDKRFAVLILRCPMIYGKDCPGNYRALRRIALLIRRAPKIENARSLLFIGNLCRYIEAYLDAGAGGMRVPQDPEFVNTSEMMREILLANGRAVKDSAFWGFVFKALSFLPAAKKAFGSLTADMALSECPGAELLGLEQAVELTEK